MKDCCSYLLNKTCLNETHSKVVIGKYLSKTCCIKNGCLYEDSLYSISKAPGKQVLLKLSRIHQFLIDTIWKLKNRIN
jgi:hypothetical protein